MEFEDRVIFAIADAARRGLDRRLPMVGPAVNLLVGLVADTPIDAAVDCIEPLGGALALQALGPRDPGDKTRIAIESVGTEYRDHPEERRDDRKRKPPGPPPPMTRDNLSGNHCGNNTG